MATPPRRATPPWPRPTLGLDFRFSLSLSLSLFFGGFLLIPVTFDVGDAADLFFFFSFSFFFWLSFHGSETGRVIDVMVRPIKREWESMTTAHQSIGHRPEGNRT